MLICKFPSAVSTYRVARLFWCCTRSHTPLSMTAAGVASLAYMYTCILCQCTLVGVVDSLNTPGHPKSRWLLINVR